MTTLIEPLVFHRRRSMNTIALDYKVQVTPVKKVSSDNRKMNSQRKIPTEQILQKGTTLLKQNYTKQASPVSKKGPQHKRCYTGIIEQNKASSQRQMALQQILNLKPKFKTTYSKKTSSSLYNYLLSLSYKNSKILEKKTNDHTFTSGLKDVRTDKNRCFSQIALKNNNIRSKQLIF